MIISCSASLLCSRMLFSFVANLSCVNRLLLFAIGEYVGGISSFCLTFAEGFGMTAFACSLFGSHLGMV